MNWFSNSKLVIESKDVQEKLQGVWIYEIGELASFSTKEVNAIKDFLTIKTDIYRSPYGRRKESHPRTAVFLGTCNDKQYLKDLTGNRRFWIVPVGQIDTDKVKAVRDQLWAEAYELYQKGEPAYLNAEFAAQAERNASDRIAMDPWLDPIREYIQIRGMNTYSFQEIFAHLKMNYDKQNHMITNRVKNCMTVLGFSFKRVRDGERLVYAFARNAKSKEPEPLNLDRIVREAIDAEFKLAEGKERLTRSKLLSAIQNFAEKTYPGIDIWILGLGDKDKFKAALDRLEIYGTEELGYPLVSSKPKFDIIEHYRKTWEQN